MNTSDIRIGEKYYHNLHGWVKITRYYETEDGYWVGTSKDGKTVIVASHRLLGKVGDGDE